MKATNKKTIYGIFILIFLFFSLLGSGEKSYETWFKKGVALAALDRYEKALEAFNKAIEIKPDYQDAWYRKGIALFKLERKKESRKAFKKAKKIKKKRKK